MFTTFLPFFLTLVLLGLLIFIYEIYMLVHVIQNQHISSDRRLLWVIGMLLIHPIVAIAYNLTDYKLK